MPLVPKNANGSKYIPSHIAIIHQCHFRLPTEQNYCEAIRDASLLFTTDKKSHKGKLEDLLKTSLKNGLKISPKKYQLFI